MGRPRKNEQAIAMFALYQAGKSLADVAAEFGVTRQSVYEGFRRRGWKLRSKIFQPTVEFNGETYAPDKNGYLRRTRGEPRRWLHQAVWEFHNGPIPAGHDIHHRDQDKLNNDITNLSCLPSLAHSHLHKVYAPVPDRNCRYCGAVLVRKWQPSGRLETPAEVTRRTYCDRTCQAADFRGRPRREHAAVGGSLLRRRG